jgi:valyl-tRNA synthetase
VNWDCHLQSAVSDLEVEFHEEQSSLYHIQYKLLDGSGYLTVATTRPETLFGDVAVAVHPDDQRYQSMIGKQLQLPLSDRIITIVADEHVDQNFGTGCVKITPGHDFNDFALAQRHDLPLVNILHLDGRLNDAVPSAFQGLDRLEARPLVIKQLVAIGALIEVKEHKNQVPRCSRTDQIIEPLLTDQWYVAMEGMAKHALQAHNDGQLNFIPQTWEKHYQHWLDNIQDWCISRQLWWGHQIPAWYDDQGHHYVGLNEADVRAYYNLSGSLKLTQDEDVLDTWFSSALWPFATLGWPDKQTKDLEDFFPTQTLVTGFDIIFFWVARMAMFSLYFTGKVPFKDIYIHGLIQDHQGVKMSKSKGNVIDPIDLIDGISLDQLILKRTQGLMQPEKAASIKQMTARDYPEGFDSYGADALRLTFAQQASPSRFIRFDIQRLKVSQNFCNKLWNMVRFTLMQLEDYQQNDVEITHPLNLWLLKTLSAVEQQVERHRSEYRFDLLAQLLVETTWTTLCDQYLEFTKVLLKDKLHRQETQATLIQAMSSILHLLHPVMPFITEELAYTLHKHLYPDQPYEHQAWL